jgi:hypothetical protein
MKKFRVLVLFLSQCMLMASGFAENALAQVNPSEDVFFYVRSFFGQLVVDTTGHPYFAEESAKIGRKLTIESPSEETHVVPEDLLPKALRIKALSMLTREGVVTSAVKEVRFRWTPSRGSLLIVTDKRGDRADIFAGALARLDKPFPPAAKLRSITDNFPYRFIGHRGDSSAGRTLARELLTWVRKTVALEHRAFFDELQIQAADFRFVEGRFGKTGKWLAWADAQRFSAGLSSSFQLGAILSEDGVVIQQLEAPRPGRGDGLGAWTPSLIVDLEGDDCEEFVVEVSTYETGEVRLYRNKDGMFVSTLLTEDGT